MARLIFLDAGPLGLLAKPRGSPSADECRAWLAGLTHGGSLVYVSAVVDYEVRRELHRVGATAGLRRLDGLRERFLYLPMNREAFDRAAQLWSLLRSRGLPTAGDASLDADCLLAAQSLTAPGLGDEAVIATTNRRHLERFPGVVAREWRSVV